MNTADTNWGDETYASNAMHSSKSVYKPSLYSSINITHLHIFSAFFFNGEYLKGLLYIALSSAL
jgi:hypothetical protein